MLDGGGTQEVPDARQARAEAEHIARASFGKLVAIVASRTHDIAAAEDALADAFAKAIARWPLEGVPDNPEGWLVTVARNELLDVAKSAAVRTAAGSLNDETYMAPDHSLADTAEPLTEFKDDRLKLLFACAHPALDASIHTPLMLQVVLGFEANDIARAYLMPGATLAQQLVRAKRKIKDARIPFALPELDVMPERLSSVLEAIYGAYALSWQDPQDPDVTRDLADEALYLASVLCQLLPAEPEVLGFAALLAYSMARRAAREGEEYLPLQEHDTAAWEPYLLKQANVLLQHAHRLGRPGRFQIEAAIQSAHSDRAHTGTTDWRAIAMLYEALMQAAPTIGAAVARAAAYGQAFGAGEGLAVLARDFPDEKDNAVVSFQPYWATKAYLLREVGRRDEATVAYQSAIEHATDPRLQRWLAQQARDGAS